MLVSELCVCDKVGCRVDQHRPWQRRGWFHLPTSPIKEEQRAAGDFIRLVGVTLLQQQLHRKQRQGSTSTAREPSIPSGAKVPRKLDHVPAAMFLVASPSIRMPCGKESQLRMFNSAKDLGMRPTGFVMRHLPLYGLSPEQWLEKHKFQEEPSLESFRVVHKERVKPPIAPAPAPELVPKGLLEGKPYIGHALQHRPAPPCDVSDALSGVGEDGPGVDVGRVERAKRGAEAQGILTTVDVHRVGVGPVLAGAPGVEHRVHDDIDVYDVVVYDSAEEVYEGTQCSSDKGSQGWHHAELEETYELVWSD